MRVRGLVHADHDRRTALHPKASPLPPVPLRRAAPRSTLLLCLSLAAAVLACEQPDPELVPDEVLQRELGLTADDRVHTVRLSTGVAERADPSTVSVQPGEYVQFVSTDWLVHEVAFDFDSLGAAATSFLTRTGQGASPPLLERDARFVVSFAEAPPGRYPYGLAGNRESGRGVVIVTEVERR